MKTADTTGLRGRLRQIAFLRPFVTPRETLLHRAARGTGWLFSLRLSEKVFALTRTLVLARLLRPADFGLFGIVMIAVNALDLLNINGIKAALVQKRDETRAHVDTAWTVMLLQGAFNASLLVAFAGPIAVFFGEPRAAELIRVFSVALLLDGGTSIGVVYFEKELQFHKQFVFVLLGATVDLVTTMALALATRSVWSLVVGAVAGKLVRLASSYWMHPYRPAFRLDSTCFNDLFRFGRWFWVSTALQFAVFQGDNVFVGRVLGATALGLYAVAYSLGTVTRTDVGIMLQRVMFPSFSRIQHDREQMRAVYLKVTRATTALVLPIAAGIALSASEFVALVLGAAWLPAIPVLRLLAAVGLFSAMLGNAGTLLRAAGVPKQASYSEIVFLLVGGSLIYPCARFWGLSGVALAVSLGAAGGWIYSEQQVRSYIGSTWREFGNATFGNLVATVGMALCILGTRTLLPPLHPAIALAVWIVFGVLSYVAFQLLLHFAVARGVGQVEAEGATGFRR